MQPLTLRSAQCALRCTGAANMTDNITLDNMTNNNNTTNMPINNIIINIVNIAIAPSDSYKSLFLTSDHEIDVHFK